MTWIGLLLLFAQQVPQLHDRVNDQAGVLRATDAEAIRTLLYDLERTDSTQVVLLTIPTTSGRPIEQYALETARANSLGQKTKNNGVLIVVAVQDHKCRIEVGTGLEGRLTDAMSWHIISTRMIPQFKAGDYSAGSRAGVEAVAQAIRGEYKVPLGQSGDGLNDTRVWYFAVLMFIVVVILRFVLKNVAIIFALSLVWPFVGMPIIGATLGIGSWFFLFIEALFVLSLIHI